MNFVYGAFTDEDVLNAVNESLKASGKRVRAISVRSAKEDIFQLESESGKLLLAHLWSPTQSLMGIRAIHQLRDRYKSFTYLFNGQGGRNLKTLSFFGEEGKLWSSTAEKLEAYLRTICVQSDKEKVEAYIAQAMAWEANRNPLIGLSPVKGTGQKEDLDDSPGLSL